MYRLLFRRVATSSPLGMQRHFASADRIRTSIQKMLVNEEALPDEELTTRNSVQLRAALDLLKKQLKEASQCINDCKKQDGEIVEAEQALDQAVLCLLDVVETKMQHPTEDYVKKIRDLREELGNLSRKQLVDTGDQSSVGA